MALPSAFEDHPASVVDIVAAGAASLWERLDSSGEPNLRPEAVKELLSRWDQALSRGAPGGLPARLSALGLSLEQVSRCLSPLASGPRPSWTSTLEALMREARAAEPVSPPAWADEARPIPFEELFAPLVAVAARKLSARRAESTLALPARAEASLQRALVAQAAQIAGPTLDQLFSRGMPQGKRLLQLLNQSTPRLGTRDRYHAFVRHQLSEGYRSLFLAYPVLGRLLSAAVDRWVSATCTLLERIERDLPQIAAFAGGSEQIVDLQVTGSDPHDGGQRVVIVHLDDGVRVVYKPRDVTIDAAFHSFVERLNRRCPAQLDLLAPRVLARDGYGWVEFIESRPCTDSAQLERFYRRAGALIAAVHALRGTDCHFENVIACGEHPVLIDPETLLHGQIRANDGIGLLSGSILRTGLPPSWSISGSGRAIFDISALGSRFEGAALVQLVWKDTNTDDMSVRWQPGPPPAQPNLPYPPERPVPARFGQAIAEGHREAAAMLRQVLPDELSSFRRARARIVLRPTHVYTAIRAASLLPKALTDGAAFSIAIDTLAYAALATPGEQALLKAEISAMHDLDIPRFSARTGGLQLSCRGEPVPGARLAKSGVKDALDGIEEDDTDRQAQILSASLAAREARLSDAPAALVPVPCAQASDERLLDAAEGIADEIIGASLRDSDNQRQWLGLSLLEEHGRYQLSSLGHDLYGGKPGIALFLAALHRITGSDAARDAALEAARSLAEQSRDPIARASIVRQIGIGGGDGVGGALYALATISRLLSEPALLDAASDLALALTDDILDGDADLDVIGGSAGAILGLLALHAQDPTRGALERAVRAGRHLLARRTGESGSRAWRIGASAPSPGFAHGASGIALALARLSVAAEEPMMWEAAMEAIAFERGSIDALRSEAGQPSLRWCRDAAGLGLARLEIFDLCGAPALREEHEVAVSALAADALQSADHLCCGNAGRIDMLVSSGSALGERERLCAARKIAEGMLDRRSARGRFALRDPSPAQGLHCGLFQGVAGVGYALLRLLDPSLPSVLSWAPSTAR